MISSKAYIVAVALIAWTLIVSVILALLPQYDLKVLISLVLIGFLGVFLMVDRSYAQIPFMIRLRYMIYTGVGIFILMVIQKLSELVNL
jgi:hypothetical protein